MTPLHLSSAAAFEEEETFEVGALRILRVRRPPYEKAALGRRALWTVVANTKLITPACRDLRRADEVLFAGSPPFLVHWLVPLNLFPRRRLTYRITDFHPEVLTATSSARRYR